jgi:hypothetical protein
VQPIEKFLSLVLPTKGTRVLVEFTDAAKYNHTFVEDTPFAEIADDALAIDATGHTVYMAMGGFEPETVSKHAGRKAENARWFKSLWIDIDIGPDSAEKYPTRQEALHALTDFINAKEMPHPLLVDSGHGFHVYWPLDADIDAATWKAYAQSLKALAQQHGLLIDATCTADAARILRPVGTHNYKFNLSKEVRVIKAGGPVALTALQKYLTTLPVPASTTLPARVNGKHHDAFGLGAVSAANPDDFSAKKLVEGCQQFNWAYHNQSEVKEPMWRAMIGTLYRTDKPHSIHIFSKKHPGYTFEETEKKALAWAGGGVTCATLESMRPGGCVGCAKYGVIKSPSSLAVRTPAPEPPPRIDTSTGMPEHWLKIGKTLCLRSDDGPQLLYNGTIEFGQPFKERDPMSKNDIQFLPLTAHSSFDTHTMFLHMGTHASPQELKKAFSTVGILPETRMEKEFYNGMRAWIQEITDKSTSVKPVRQMGWQSHESSNTDAGFVLGNTLYVPGGKHIVRVDAAAEKHSTHMKTVGSFDEWKRAINMYSQPEYASYALMSWLMFGAPLARLLGIGMPVAHFNSQGSGHGKTGTQDLLLSGAGNPRDPNGRWTGNTTIISIYAYLTAMNGNVAILDETSAIPPETLGKLMFEATLGSGRKAMQGSSGQTRDLPPITGILCTSGNVSLQQLAQTMKGNSEAQVARVFEFNVRRPDLSTARRYADQEIFKQVYDNYGHAMPPFIEYVVNNQAKVKIQLAKVEKQLVDALGMNNEERFWRGLLTVCITGALIAKRLGIIDHDVNALLPAALKHFHYQRSALADDAAGGSGHVLHQFVQDNQSAVLVVDTDTPAITSTGMHLVTAMRTPPAHINTRMRFVLDSHKLFVDRKFLRAYCSEKNLDFRLLIATAEREGWLVSDRDRRELTSHTRVNTPARVVCVCFDMAKADTVVAILKGQ